MILLPNLDIPALASIDRRRALDSG